MAHCPNSLLLLQPTRNQFHRSGIYPSELTVSFLGVCFHFCRRRYEIGRRTKITVNTPHSREVWETAGKCSDGKTMPINGLFIHQIMQLPLYSYVPWLNFVQESVIPFGVNNLHEICWWLIAKSQERHSVLKVTCNPVYSISHRRTMTLHLRSQPCSKLWK